MKKTWMPVLGILLFIVTNIVNGQRNYPPEIQCSNEVIYKVVDGVELKLWIFNPLKHKSNDKKPAVVFFFGGGWNGGSPEQFVPHCEYLSARGMVAMVADYRVKTRHKVLANKCVSDAKSAVRWIRENAATLGVNPNKIAAGGGSAGGHLAAATATLPQYDEPNENSAVSSKPNALLLFNPALVIAPVNSNNDDFNKKMEGIEGRMGVKPQTMSPYHNIKTGIPPTVIFHGTGDTTVPFFTVEMFAKKMKEFGNSCTLVAYKDEPHGFFNYGKKENGPFIDTVNKMDKFLVSLGYLKTPPETKIVK